MIVEWVEVEKERPETNEWGMSEQLILKTSKDAYATGYYSKEYDTWHCDGILFKDEVVKFWMRRLFVGFDGALVVAVGDATDDVLLKSIRI